MAQTAKRAKALAPKRIPHPRTDPDCTHASHDHPHHHGEFFTAWSNENAQPFSLDALLQAARKLPASDYRCKGVITPPKNQPAARSCKWSASVWTFRWRGIGVDSRPAPALLLSAPAAGSMPPPYTRILKLATPRPPTPAAWPERRPVFWHSNSQLAQAQAKQAIQYIAS